MTDLLTTSQVQDKLRVDRTTIYRMVEDGRLPAIRVGKQWRFQEDAIERWLHARGSALPATVGHEATAPVTPRLCCVAPATVTPAPATPHLSEILPVDLRAIDPGCLRRDVGRHAGDHRHPGPASHPDEQLLRRSLWPPLSKAGVPAACVQHLAGAGRQCIPGAAVHPQRDWLALRTWPHPAAQRAEGNGGHGGHRARGLAAADEQIAAIGPHATGRAGHLAGQSERRLPHGQGAARAERCASSNASPTCSRTLQKTGR